MKRIIAILSAIIVVLFCLCACGKVNGSETTESTPKSTEVHVHAYGEWQTIKEADCVNVGERERTCLCGETETEEIPAFGHTGGTADCKTLAKCERCGEEYGDYGPHTGGAATCEVRAKCEYCGEEYGDYAHTGGTAYCIRRAVCSLCKKEYGELNADNHVSVRVATCTKKAKCTYCKKEIGDSVDPSNHLKWNGKGIDKECKACHKTFLPETDTSIVDSTNEKPIDYNEYLKKVTDERVARLSKAYSSVALNYIRDNKNKLLTSEERRKCVSTIVSNVGSSIITREKAFEDVKICFKGFYTYYSLYEYFGEDKFENAEKKAINAVNEFFDSGKEQISDTVLYNIIASSLDFIIDTHSNIRCSTGGRAFTSLNNKFYYAYYVKDIVFREDDIGYYTIANSNKWYLKDVNGGDFSDYLKVTIDESGELVYALVMIANPSAEKHDGDTFTLQRGNVTYIHNVSWSKYNTRQSTGETTAGVRIENGVPVIHARSFSDAYAYDLQKYSALGSYMKNQKLFVVDLRGNRGGLPNYIADWSKNYSAHSQIFEGCIIGQMSIVADASYVFASNRVATVYKDSNNKIVLVDKNVASSGELAYLYYSSISNTLIVGSNTLGCIHASKGIYIQLPNSKIILEIGNLYWDYYNYYYKGMNPEGIGLMPDVFVNSTEALDLSMKMIEYYGIEKSKDTSGITTFGTGKR